MSLIKVLCVLGGFSSAFLFYNEVWPNLSAHNLRWNSKEEIGASKTDNLFCRTIVGIGKEYKYIRLHKVCSIDSFGEDYYDNDGDKKVDSIHWTIFEPFSIFNSFDELDRGSEYTTYGKEYVPDSKSRFDSADSLLEKELKRFDGVLKLEGDYTVFKR